MTPHAVVASSREVKAAIPSLADLAQLIGDPAVRHRGTIGGSIANNDPAADYPAACLALGATIVTNRRQIPAADFFKGLFETALDEGEMITKVSFPVPEKAGYAKFRNPASRFALVGVFVAKTADGARVAVTGAGSSGVFRVAALEEALSKNFAPEAVAGVKVPADGLNSGYSRRCRLPGASHRRADQAGSRGRALTCHKSTSSLYIREAGPIVGRPLSRLTYRSPRIMDALTARKPMPESIDAVLKLLRDADYVGDRSLATVLFLALKMARPLFLEGEAGVGKTELAKVLAKTLGRQLIRLQCYEGLDISSAVYEWNYAGQMMAIRLAEASGETDRDRIEHDVFAERYLVKRPLLRALEPAVEGAPVLLIDELDRTDEAFEAFLLEVLSDFQVTIPELGTVKAVEPPVVIITSNRTREIHDALKRRCLYHWIDYPDATREMAIVRAKVPGISERLSADIVAFVQAIRKEDLFKAPGVAETLDWATALTELDAVALDPATASDTLGVLLKYQDDIAKMQGSKARELIEGLKADARATA